MDASPGHKVTLRRKRLSDARNDYKWQTDPELTRLDAMPQLTASFARYLLDYTVTLRNPASTRRVYAIEVEDGRHIGNCVYYNIDNVRGDAELGIMIGEREYWGKGFGADAVSALLELIFRETALRRIYLKTLQWNKRAQKCFRKCGFTPCGSIKRNGHDFMLMELYREKWEGRQSRAEAGSRSA